MAFSITSMTYLYYVLSYTCSSWAKQSFHVMVSVSIFYVIIIFIAHSQTFYFFSCYLIFYQLRQVGQNCSLYPKHSVHWSNIRPLSVFVVLFLRECNILFSAVSDTSLPTIPTIYTYFFLTACIMGSTFFLNKCFKCCEMLDRFFLLPQFILSFTRLRFPTDSSESIFKISYGTNLA